MKQGNAVVDKGSTVVVHPTPGLGDATTIVDALAMLGSSGGSLLLREGTYSITSTITMPDAPVVIKGCGDSTIISLGANVIAAFTIPNSLTARRNYLFEDFLVTGTSVAGQKIWSLQNVDSQGILLVRRVNSSGIQFPVDITAGSGAPDNEPITINLDDCHFIPLAAGTGILINMVNALITVNAYMQRVRFYDIFEDAVTGTLTPNNILAGINILGEDNLFAVGTSCTVGALNLTNSVIYNFGPNPNPTITTEDDNSGLIPSELTGCGGAFVNFAFNGNGTAVDGGNYQACAFTDGAISRFSNVFFFRDPGTAFIITGNGSTFVGNCWFDSSVSTTTLDGSFETIIGNEFRGSAGTATIRLSGSAAVVTGNRFDNATPIPILETLGAENVISNNYYNGPPPTLNATTQTLGDLYHNVPTKGSMFEQTASQTIANSGAETTLFGTGVGGHSLPISYLVPGKSIRIRMSGTIADTGNPTMTVNVKLGSTIVATTGAVNFGSLTGTHSWFIDAIITCRTTGVGGTVFAQGKFEISAASMQGMPSTSPVTVNTTTTLPIDVTFTWGTADPADTITCTNATVEAL